jgi:membrane protease YdiL (CAAX protease family)
MLKTSCSSGQLNIANSLPAVRPAQFFNNRLKTFDTSLLAETILVTTVAVLTIKVFGVSLASEAGWFIAPAILIAAALIPTGIKKSKLSEIGLTIGQIKHSLVVLGWTCFVVFPAVFYGLWLLKSCGLNLPLRPVLPEGQSWICWLSYQFMYVAVAEEVFFRGFLQTNILRLTKAIADNRFRLRQWISIGVSAACFAVAHIIVSGQIISVLTFLPGLVLGWLFIRTKSLLAPILFHGLANACYGIMATALA